MHKQMFITVEGGLIQDIDVSADLDVHVTVVDLDTEGVDDAEIVKLPWGDEARVYSFVTDEIGNGDIEAWEEVLEKES